MVCPVCCRHGRLQSFGQALLLAAPEVPGYVLTTDVDDDPALSVSFRNDMLRQYRTNELVRYCLKHHPCEFLRCRHQ